VFLELSFKIPWTSIRWLFETYNIMIIFLCSYVVGLWGGDLSISISPCRRLSVCVCHTDSKNTLFPFMLAESHSRSEADSPSPGLEVLRSGDGAWTHAEAERAQCCALRLTFSDSPSLSLSLSEGDSFSRGEFQWEGKGNGNGNGSGNVPISHFIKHKHTLTNTRPVFLPLLRFSQSPFLCRRAADFCNGQILIFMHFGGKRIKWTIDRVA